MTQAHDRSAKESWQLVLFTNNQTGAELMAVTDRDSDYSFDGVDYTSETRLEVALPENNGILSEQQCNIRLPVSTGFVEDASCGLPYYEMKVEIIEVTKAEDASTSHDRTFTGLVVTTLRNVAGRRGFAGFLALPVKSRLASATLGLPCNHHCINRLGDGSCGVVMSTSPNRRLVTVESLDGRKLVTTAASVVPTGLDDHFYRKGYVNLNGLSIMIQDWRNEIEGDRTEFFLYRRPPTDWVGSQIQVFTGCDKTIETCRAKFNKESQFNGIGYHMPAYHPSYEDGGSKQ